MEIVIIDECLFVGVCECLCVRVSREETSHEHQRWAQIYETLMSCE